MTIKPVIFLAFANDRVADASYLRNLPKEHRGIRDALNKAIKTGLCDVVERANATIDDIMAVFQDESYKDRIAVFHYGGHANGYKLLLETFTGGISPAHSEGLVSFLARQKGLKLVFLNGCSTEQHALDLEQAGIPSVIGTSQVIDDNVAAKLAIRFYNGIANGHSLERAWLDAEDYLKILKGSSNFKDLYWYGNKEPEDRFPWTIYYKKGAERVKGWNLPHAVNNPLFGLPPIPRNFKLPDTPFLFLGRYQRKHAELFFGRSDYTRELYDRVTDKNSSPIILLYGQSGVGKSSLLEAGLMPRLEQSHNVVYLRRNKERGLSATLEKTLERQINKKFCGGPGGGFSKEPPGRRRQISEKWKIIESEKSRPLIIILDQVEEVFTHSNKKLHRELEEFSGELKTLFDNPAHYPEGKLILGYRKEYHPEIDEHLKNNELDRASLFIKPLKRRDIIEVVTGITRNKPLADKYNLKVEAQLPVIIADDLLEDKNTPVAPTLQVILTKMWDAARKDDLSPIREFSIKGYQDLRRQGLLMEDFFKQQMEKLGSRQKGVIDSGLALDLLKFHTTRLGTTCTRDINEIQETYPHARDIIDELVKQLKYLYLLTDTRHSKKETSLVHDTLAPIVIKEYNNSNKPGQRAARVLDAKIRDFKRNQSKIWLDESDLEIVEHGKKGMRALSGDEEKLVEISLERKAQREERNKKRIRTRVALIAFIIIALVFAGWQWKVAYDRAKSERTTNANYLASKARLIASKDPTIALRLAEKARQLDNNLITNETIYKIFRENNFYRIFVRQDQAITSVAVSSNNKYVLTGAEDGAVRLWDLQGKKLQDFSGHKGRVLSVAFSPNVKYILTGSIDRTARLWDFQGNEIREFKGSGSWVFSAVFSPDGRYILTGSVDQTARLWDLKGQKLQDFKGHTGWVYATVFSPDGQYVLTVSGDKTACLWDLRGNRLHEFHGHENSVISAAFSPDGRYIITGSKDKTLRLWDLQGNQLQVFIGHKDRVCSAEFSPCGRYILTGSYDRTARLWDLQGNEIETGDFRGHKGRVSAALFSPDGRFIFSGSADKTLRLWELKGKELQVLTGHENRVYSVAFSADGRRILTGLADGTLREWDLKGNKLQDLKRRENIARTTAFSPDGKYILAGSFDNTARLWDLKGNQLQVFRGHESRVSAVAFSPDRKYIITGSFDRTARLWKIYELEDFLKNGVCERLSDGQLKELGGKKW